MNLNRVQTRMLAFISHIGTGIVRRALTMIGCLPIVSGNIGRSRAGLWKRSACSAKTPWARTWN